MKLLYFITGFLFGLLVMYGYMKARDRKSADKPDTGQNPSTDSGQAHSASSGQSSELISEQQQEKEQNLKGVMRLFDEHDPPSRKASEGQGDIEITNDDVQEALGVSDATASRYLTELEEQGRIEQIGEEGRHVSYKKVK